MYVSVLNYLDSGIPPDNEGFFTATPEHGRGALSGIGQLYHGRCNKDNESSILFALRTRNITQGSPQEIFKA